MVSSCTPIPINSLYPSHCICLRLVAAFQHGLNLLIGLGLPPACARGYPIFFSFGLYEARLYKLALFSCLSLVMTQVPFVLVGFFDSSSFADLEDFQFKLLDLMNASLFAGRRDCMGLPFSLDQLYHSLHPVS